MRKQGTGVRAQGSEKENARAQGRKERNATVRSRVSTDFADCTDREQVEARGRKLVVRRGGWAVTEGVYGVQMRLAYAETDSLKR